jgi:hypothetical protein
VKRRGLFRFTVSQQLLLGRRRRFGGRAGAAAAALVLVMLAVAAGGRSRGRGARFRRGGVSSEGNSGKTENSGQQKSDVFHSNLLA